MKILLCFGTRPEAIKMAPLYYKLKEAKINFITCVTAQHREMLDDVLNFFEIKTDYDLDLMQRNQTLNNLSSRIISSIDKVLNKENPTLVIIHGDTTTSTMVALASFHRGIKVAHVEAGLRTHNKLFPFPEEMNRQITAKLADYHFAPTVIAKNNLIEEGVDKENILVTGNTGIDSLLLTVVKLRKGYSNFSIDDLKKKISLEKKIILVTAHRRENFGKGLENLCKAILQISNNKEVEIVFPIHLNPNIKEVVYKFLSGIENVHLIEPLNYPSFVWLMSLSYLIISDSGGIQEEAPSLNVPVIVIRDLTEREESLKLGYSFLVGTNIKKIVTKANEILIKKESQNKFVNPYGDGNSSQLIINYLKNINND